MTETTTQCQATTTDWSICERPAARTVEGARFDGKAQNLCEQHAKRVERAIARKAR